MSDVFEWMSVFLPLMARSPPLVSSESCFRFALAADADLADELFLPDRFSPRSSIFASISVVLVLVLVSAHLRVCIPLVVEDDLPLLVSFRAMRRPAPPPISRRHPQRCRNRPIRTSVDTDRVTKADT